MTRSGRKMLIPLSLALTVIAVVLAVAPTTALSAASAVDVRVRSADAVENGESRQIELRRIHVHFDSVLFELSNADVSQLTKTQRANRGTLVKTLRGYSRASDFPHNYDFATPTPYFIDRKTGRLCAVAFLLESTGQRALVNRVAHKQQRVGC